MLHIVFLGAMIFDSLLAPTESHYVVYDNGRARLRCGQIENSNLIYAVELQHSRRFPLVDTVRPSVRPKVA